MESEASDEVFKNFLMILVEIEHYYKRIYPFRNMFYKFVHNGNKIAYRAAVRLLKEIADENGEEGKIIEKAKCSWNITSRNVTHNVGRLKLKRYLGVLANQRLREKYFDFYQAMWESGNDMIGIGLARKELELFRP